MKIGGISMYFTINAYKMSFGFGNDYRLKNDNNWRKIDSYTDFDPDIDLLFSRFQDAEYWLSKNPVIEINGEMVDQREKVEELFSDKFDLSIIAHRVHKPNNPIFTKEQVRKVLLDGDDNYHNSLIIDLDGFPRLIRVIGRTPLTLTDFAVRFETFNAGNGYVGKNSGLNHLDSTYLTLLEGWLSHLQSGQDVYTDCQLENKTKDEYLKEINQELSKLK
jgi:hypothetical protein